MFDEPTVDAYKQKFVQQIIQTTARGLFHRRYFYNNDLRVSL